MLPPAAKLGTSRISHSGQVGLVSTPCARRLAVTASVLFEVELRLSFLSVGFCLCHGDWHRGQREAERLPILYSGENARRRTRKELSAPACNAAQVDRLLLGCLRCFLPSATPAAGCPGGERERERERSHFGSSATPVLGGLCRPLVRGGEDGELTRGCALGGAFPFDPVVLELHFFVAEPLVIILASWGRSMASSTSLSGGREGGENRPLSAKPPKVKATWEEQLRLAERLREIGVTCKTCLHGPWYHKPHDGGDGCYKHMISAGRVSSPLSVAELRKRGEASTAQATEPVAAGDYTTGKTSKRPLSEYVRFETKEGMVLLFHPSPLDK